MPEMSWRDAVMKVLSESTEAMHYADIADAIAEQKLRTEVGATPQQTVNVVISQSINQEGNNSPFIRVERGRYWLRDLAQQAPAQPPPVADQTAGLINAFGMYWSRQNILWTSNPGILGQQQSGSTPVDFSHVNAGRKLTHFTPKSPV